MEIKFIDIQNGRPIPAPLCYTVPAFKSVVDYYGEDAGAVFAVLQYTFSLSPENNPYAYVDESIREELIHREIADGINLATSVFEQAKNKASELAETTELKVFRAYKNLMEKMTKAIDEIVPNLNSVSAGGNMSQIKEAVKSHKDLQTAYRDSFETYIRSQKSAVTENFGYDEDSDDDDLD